MTTQRGQEHLTSDELSKFHKGLAEFDRELKKSSPFGEALYGAALGAAIGFAVHKKGEERHVLKHAAWGGGIAFGVGFVLKQLLKKGSSLAHNFERFEQEQIARDTGRATTHIPAVALPGGRKVSATVVWPEGVEAPPPGWFDQPPPDAASIATQGMFYGASYEGGGWGSQWPSDDYYPYPRPR